MFDPSSASFEVFGLGKWVFIMVPLLLVGWPVFASPLGPAVVSSSFVNGFKKGGSQYTSYNGLSQIMIMLVGVFVTLFCWNELGLVPFGFGVSSHLVVNLSLGVALFVVGIVASFKLAGWKSIVSHMVPYGAPLSLSFVLVLVETTSYLIRPLTLSLRLTGNIITGHLLVALLCEAGSVLAALSTLGSVVMVVLSACLLFFEVLVSLVQASIFTILVFIYWTEG